MTPTMRSTRRCTTSSFEHFMLGTYHRQRMPLLLTVCLALHCKAGNAAAHSVPSSTL